MDEMTMTQERLEELRKTIAHADLEDLGLIVSAEDGQEERVAVAETVEDVREYLKSFARFPRDEEGKFIKGNPCIGCGENMAGGLAEQLLARGGFTWGLAHGHGHCRNCGWPATLYHFIKDRHGKDLCTVRGILLQAHPDTVSLKKEHQ
jgi:hypothetical protein